MSVRPRRTAVDHETTGEAVALRVLTGELKRLGVLKACSEAETMLRSLKSGPPQLVIIQQGRMEDLQDTLEALRNENQELESQNADLAQQRQAFEALVQKALEAIRWMTGKSEKAELSK